MAVKQAIATHTMTTPLNLIAARGAVEDLRILSHRQVAD